MSPIRYPKFLLLFCSFALAYVLYQQGVFDTLPILFQGHGYVSMFIGGILFAFGFTAPFGIAIFVAMAPIVNPVLGAIIAGAGALLADLSIFQFVRLSFLDELSKFKASAVAQWMRDKLHRENVPERIRQYVTWSIAGIMIASPLPDEIGVTLISGLTELKGRPFAITCYTLNTLGVLIILLAAAGSVA